MAQKSEFDPNQPQDPDTLLATGDQPQEVNNHLTTHAPPSYSEATVSYGWTVGNLEQTGKDGRSLEDEVVVTLEEVNTAIAQNAPGTVLTHEQKETIKRLTESILKRNVHEQGVLPTALQREITLAHVVTNFNKTRLQQETVSASYGLSTSPQILTTVTCTVNNPSTVVTTPPQPSASGRQGNKQILASWTRNGTVTSYTYTDVVPRYTACLAVFAVLCFCFTSPLSLLCTVPGLYWILKVRIYTVHNYSMCLSAF